jgi:hypothetical protein
MPTHYRRMSIRSDLIKEIADFLKETGEYPTLFGLKAVGDRALMISLGKGRDPQTKTVERIRAYIAKERARRAKRDLSPPKRAQAQAA